MKKIAPFLPLFLAVATPAAAQAVPEPGQVLGAALQTVQAIDQDQAGQVWDEASSLMKYSVPKDRFVALIAQKQAQGGRMQGREWQSINRLHVATAQPNLPTGEYISITFAGVGKNKPVSHESVSFVLDTDKVWRLAGYTAQ